MSSKPVPVSPERYDEIDPRIEALVNDIIAQVADKWTMHLIEVLHDHGELRFTRIGEQMPGISQKMLIRTVHAVVPPKVEYRLTSLGMTLGEAFCGVWSWAEDSLDEVEAARQAFDARAAG
jgi:DNA-binding HxlR family transcriptional regulator